ncbi:MAG: hypothetical protein E6J23_10405 [Chloroflexi bacterium]|nr:MAG: hypothetical protein E6J23_10405 [Chloroflexota bacterium]
MASAAKAQTLESPVIDPTPLSVVRMTPPVEATLRILLNSVPYLIGAAVVRQPAVGEAVEAEVGRMPWLHDRRLLTLQLPDDSLPANKAILLDWPVPYQAEWVGVPPRLLISRLVTNDRTVGVLLGTLISRDQLSAAAREALDLSCELIAAAVGSDSLATVSVPAPADETRHLVIVPDELMPEPESSLVIEAPAESEPVLDPKDEQDERDRQVVDEVARALDELTDARSIGRVLRDAVTAIAGVDGFSVALFNSVRREVAYRYKVVGADPDSAEMGRQAVDDGPDCYAARHDRRWHGFVREIGVRGPEGVEARKISVLQYPLIALDEVFGVATLQIFGDTGFSDHATRLVLRVIEVSSDRLAAVRRAARFQPSLSPSESAAAAVLPPVAAAPSFQPPTTAEAPTTDQILNDLVTKCTEIGLPTTFMVGVDPAAGLLRGELISTSPAARELDYALGISVGRFTIELSDRYNAIARACREGRIVTSPTLDELVQPLRDADGAATLERLVQGGRSTIIPITVSGDVVGALVVGPMADEPGFSTIVKVRDLVNETASRLAEAWRTKH